MASESSLGPPSSSPQLTSLRQRKTQSSIETMFSTRTNTEIEGKATIGNCEDQTMGRTPGPLHGVTAMSKVVSFIHMTCVQPRPILNSIHEESPRSTSISLNSTDVPAPGLVVPATSTPSSGTAKLEILHRNRRNSLYWKVDLAVFQSLRTDLMKEEQLFPKIRR